MHTYLHTHTHTHTHTHASTDNVPVVRNEGILLMVSEKERGKDYHFISKLTLVYDFHLID